VQSGLNHNLSRIPYRFLSVEHQVRQDSPDLPRIEPDRGQLSKFSDDLHVFPDWQFVERLLD